MFAVHVDEETEATNVSIEIAGWTRATLKAEMGIKEARFSQLLQLLITHCPNEFKYKSKQRIFSAEQRRMLKKLRNLFLPPPKGAGLIEAQVIEILITRGI